MSESIPPRPFDINDPAVESLRNWLAGRYLSDPAPARRGRLSREDLAAIRQSADPAATIRSLTEPRPFITFDAFDERVQALGLDVHETFAELRHLGWIESGVVEVSDSTDPNKVAPNCYARLDLLDGLTKIVGIRPAVLRRVARPAEAMQEEPGSVDKDAGYPTEQEIVDQLDRTRKRTQARLVEFMIDKKSATYEDIGEHVHGYAVDSDAIRQNVTRTNKSLAKLHAPFRFDVGNSRVFKVPAV